MSDDFSCALDSDCPDGYECVGGRCVPIIDGGGGGGTPPSVLPGLGRLLRPRFTSNLAVVEQMVAMDLINDVINVASRQYLTMSTEGKIALRNKKPAPYAFGTEQFSAAETGLDVDTITDWIGDTDTLLLVAPHTTSSEIANVTAADYPVAQNSIVFSSTGGIFTISGFSGCDGASTPATASITVTGVGTAPVSCSLTLEGITFEFITSSGDTTESIASYIAGVIATHPALFRRFDVSWVAGASVVNLTAKWGTLTIGTGLLNTTAAPVADPITAPTLAGSSGGTLLAGAYAVAYSYINGNGETLISQYKVVTLSASQKIDVSAITLPAGVLSVNWYTVPEAASTKLRFIANNNGAAFSITTLPKLSAPLPAYVNATGCEVIKIKAVFTDRSETRTGLTSSNIFRASIEWSLGGSSDSVNRVDLKYRDSADDWRLVDLRIRDDENINKVKAVKNKEYNGQGIDNTDQAYRIASALLAEGRDGNFFFKWKAARTAMLLQEGDVVAITDDGSGVVNFPVIVEAMAFGMSRASRPEAQFTARKYASTLYDDCIVDRNISVVSEPAAGP